MEGYYHEEAAAADQTETYQCPVLGCEREFMEYIELQHHKTTAHADEWLHDNSDDTFSVINKETGELEDGPFAGIRACSPERDQALEQSPPNYAPPSFASPQNTQGSASTASIAPSAAPGTQNFLIEGRTVNVPIISTNASGVSNPQKCGPCLRGKRGVDCTGPIPVCDQCRDKGYDEEICTSHRKIADIRASRQQGQA